MYELPSMEQVSKVIIDENCVSGDSAPIVMYENQTQEQNFATTE